MRRTDESPVASGLTEDGLKVLRYLAVVVTLS
jgi:hypothetical protein